VISGSVTDTKPVFDAIVQSCQRLFAGRAVALAMPVSGMIESVAFAGDAGERRNAIIAPWPLDRSSGAGTCILESRVINVADTGEAQARFPRMRDLAIALGYRSALFVPLLREGRAVGCIAILRAALGRFDDQEVSLAQTFADQAVIAIENARLFNETKEALDQQRASAEVLAAISNSIADAKPVFETILQRCQHLFAGENVGVTLVRDDGMVDIGAYAGEGADELRKLFPQPLDRESASGVAILDRKVLMYADIETDDIPERSRAGCRAIGLRSMIFAPMLSEGRAIGTLWIGRASPGGFSDKQVALLRTFAEQAVIAIQNARLFNETTEALERQTATANVLKVISASPTDVQPVFEAIAESAANLCGANFCHVFEFDGQLLHFKAQYGLTGEAADAIARAPPFAPGRTSAAARAIQSRRVEEIPDVFADPEYRHGTFAGVMNFRGIAAVPMLHDGIPIGALTVSQPAAGRFSPRHIELLQTFADQAVIAVQNVRLFRETQEALDQQRASAEVLAEISNSNADTTPVFERMLSSGERLF
jgi:GAF domain-containing protein